MRAPPVPRGLTVPPPIAATSPQAIPPSAPTPSRTEPGRDGSAAQKGSIGVPAHAAGHRVFVDGRVAGTPQGPSVPLVVECGPHVVKIGHDGRDQSVDVPCGGRIDVVFP